VPTRNKKGGKRGDWSTKGKKGGKLSGKKRRGKNVPLQKCKKRNQGGGGKRDKPLIHKGKTLKGEKNDPSLKKRVFLTKEKKGGGRGPGGPPKALKEKRGEAAECSVAKKKGNASSSTAGEKKEGGKGNGSVFPVLVPL